MTPTTQCEATKEGLNPGSMRRCKRRANYGRWCFQHAHSIGGWQLVSPVEAKRARQPFSMETIRAIKAEGVAEARAEGIASSALAVKIADRLARAYLKARAPIAELCDETIDPSGNLLGWLREYAAERSASEARSE